MQVDCHVPLEPQRSKDSLLTTLSDLQLTQLRRYLTLLRLLPYNITQQVQKVIALAGRYYHWHDAPMWLLQGLEEDFVSLRQRDSEMTGAVFQYLLSLSRLLALSYGCDHLSLDVWSKAKHMDQLRRQRLDKHVWQDRFWFSHYYTWH